MILIASAAFTCLTFSLWFLSRVRLPSAYLVAFFLQQVALNVVTSTQLGLVPDVVPPSKRGFAGAASAANTLVGALAGLFSVQLFGTWDYHFNYGLIVGLTLVSCVVVFAAADEQSS